MKSILVVLFICICACFCTSCIERNTVYNFKGGVIVEKRANAGQLLFEVRYKAALLNGKEYRLVKFNAPAEEFRKFNVGDTIK